MRCPIPARHRLAFRLLSVALCLAASASSGAEILILTNGRRITVDRYWEEDEQVFYEKNGSTFGFPRHLLEHVQGERPEILEPPPPSSGYRNVIGSEELEQAREMARDLRLDRAIELYRTAIAKAPDEVVPRLELAEILLRRGELFSAQSQLEQARRIDPDDARVRELLGDVYYERGRTALAIREWQLALPERTSPGLLYKLRKALRENVEDIDFDGDDRPKFVIRYEGGVNSAVGRIVAAALDEEYFRLARELRFAPRAAVVVTLYTDQEFHDVTNSPSWVSALNDGEIRLPVEGVTEMDDRLRRVIRHELTHSFVNAITSGNCPSWFHEGLALLGEDAEKTELRARLTEARARQALLPLWTLEGALTELPREQALLAYAQALSATEYLAARRGRGALVRILELLAERKSMNDALKQVVGLDYQEFQTAWEADLARYRRTAR